MPNFFHQHEVGKHIKNEILLKFIKIDDGIFLFLFFFLLKRILLDFFLHPKSVLYNNNVWVVMSPMFDVWIGFFHSLCDSMQAFEYKLNRKFSMGSFSVDVNLYVWKPQVSVPFIFGESRFPRQFQGFFDIIIDDESSLWTSHTCNIICVISNPILFLKNQMHEVSNEKYNNWALFHFKMKCRSPAGHRWFY